MPGTASAVHSDPEILGGVPVFVGTRVPLLLAGRASFRRDFFRAQIAE